MTSKKYLKASTMFAAALGLALGLSAAPAEAHHCKGGHASEPGCDVGGGGGGSGSGKNFPAKVTFDDLDGDNITSDGNGSYSDGPGVTTGVPLEGSPPGQFRMVLVDGEGRFVFMDFGAAVDCELDDGLQGCVFDDSGAVEPVLCPFPVGERTDAAGTTNDALCSGLKQVRMFFRHALNVIVAGDEIFMLGMPNGPTYDGEADSVEFGFRAEKNVGGWRLRFDNRCLGIDGLGEFLEITAADNNLNDDAVLPNDEWQIGTGAGTKKTACLTKTVRGRSEDLIGLFDMQFGYKVCILADPDVSDLCIGESS